MQFFMEEEAINKSTEKTMSRRYGWIEGSLRYSGRFGPVEKKAYCDVFCVSDSAASRDQDNFVQLFNEKAGSEVVKKHKGKLALINQNGLPSEPVYRMPDLGYWLKESLGSKLLSIVAIGRTAPLADILRPILLAINDRRLVLVEYHSRNGGHTRRILAPHSLVDVVNRYHVRAWDYEKNRFADFLLSRITNCRILDQENGEKIPEYNDEQIPEYVDNSKDQDWRTNVNLEISVKEGENLMAAILDFGLGEDGKKRARIKKALSQYFIDDKPPGYENPITVAITRE